jgi:hypothetical protein
VGIEINTEKGNHGQGDQAKDQVEPKDSPSQGQIQHLASIAGYGKGSYCRRETLRTSNLAEKKPTLAFSKHFSTLKPARKRLELN